MTIVQKHDVVIKSLVKSSHTKCKCFCLNFKGMIFKKKEIIIRSQKEIVFFLNLLNV